MAENQEVEIGFEENLELEKLTASHNCSVSWDEVLTELEAEEQTLESKRLIASLYQSGKISLPIDESLSKALTLYEEIAGAGDPVGQIKAAKILMETNVGLSVKTAFQKAEKWLHKATEQQYFAAYRMLGQLYEMNGLELPQHQAVEKAIYWYKKTAHIGDDVSEYSLGKLYLDPIFKTETGLASSKAVFWLQKSAENGNLDAQNNLAYLYESGKIDMSREDALEKSYYWYEQAVKGGNSQAKYNLSLLYLERKNNLTKRDKQKVIQLLKECIQENEIELELVENATLHLQLLDKQTPVKTTHSDKDEIQIHIERYLGNVSITLPITYNDEQIGCLHIVKSSTTSGHSTIVTSGLNQYTKQYGSPIELMISLPGTWRLSEETIARKINQWPVDLLSTLVKRVHESGLEIEFCTLIKFTIVQTIFPSNTGFKGVMLAEPIAATKEFCHFHSSENLDINFISVIPVYQEEITLGESESVLSLMHKLEQQGVTEVLKINRKNVGNESLFKQLQYFLKSALQANWLRWLPKKYFLFLAHKSNKP